MVLRSCVNCTHITSCPIGQEPCESCMDTIDGRIIYRNFVEDNSSVKVYHENEQRSVIVGTGKDKHERVVCPKCFEESHPQGEAGAMIDCKNLFVNDRMETIGQCCCYSERHGRQEE